MPAPAIISVQSPPPQVIYLWGPPPPPPAPKEEPSPPAPPAVAPAAVPTQTSTKRQKVCFTRRKSDGGNRRICVSFPISQSARAVPTTAPEPEPAPASVKPAPSKPASTKPASSKPSSTKAPSSKPASSKLPSTKPAPSTNASKPKEHPSVERKTNSLAPPSLREGTNYMFPPTHTMLHIFNKAAPIWEPHYQNQNLDFKIFKVGTNFSVEDVIERVRGVGGDEAGREKCEGWAAVEVVEVGDGRWVRGSAVRYGSCKAKGGRLGELGWGGKRGGDLPPVWIVVMKV
ncbi:hypothetical protein MBLNU230_g8425t1 [Neophaeotheca triangularis]